MVDTSSAPEARGTAVGVEPAVVPRSPGRGDRLDATATRLRRPGRSPLRSTILGASPTMRWSVISAVCAAGFALAVLAYTRTHALSSDDVAIQNILQSVLSGAPLQPALGNDNFIVKVPIYLLVGLLPHSTWTLALTVLLCNIPLVVALLLLGRHLLGGAGPARQIIGGTIIAWYLCSQLVPVAPTVQINGRNGEIGVALLLVWWRLSAARRIDLRAAFFSILTVAAFTLLCFSDLFFLFVLLPSAAAIFGTACLTGRFRRTTGLLLVELVVAAVLAEWLLAAAQRAGMVVSQNFASATPIATELPGYAAATVAAVGRDLNADIWGQPLGLSLLPGLLQAALLMTAGVLAVRATLGLRREPDVRVAGLAWVAVVNLALFVMTSNAADPLSYRYVFMAAIVVLLLAMRGVARTPRPTRATATRCVRAITALAVVGVALGIGVNLASVARSVGEPNPQDRVLSIVALAESHGATSGLGAYWDSGITTWYSGGRVHVTPQTCDAAGVSPYPWLMNVPEMRRQDSATFVVLSTSLGCTPDRVKVAFGAPASAAPLPGGDEVWFYTKPLSR